MCADDRAPGRSLPSGLAALSARTRSVRARAAHALDRHARTAYSQEGEDLILLRRFEGGAPGFYVDVGAHHPSRFSNTKLLHDLGWRGINIDPLPGSMAAFRRARRGDVNLEIGIGTAPGPACYFRFAEPALSTFDEQLADERVAEGWPLAEKRSVAVRTLTQVLDEHCRRPITLLSIDAEGRDLDVLRSLDVQRYRPEVICVEIHRDGGDEIVELLNGHGFGQWARTMNSALFEDATRG